MTVGLLMVNRKALKALFLGLGAWVLTNPASYADQTDIAPETSLQAANDVKGPQEDILESKAVEPTTLGAEPTAANEKSKLNKAGLYSVGGKLLIDRNVQVNSVTMSTLTVTSSATIAALAVPALTVTNLTVTSCVGCIGAPLSVSTLTVTSSTTLRGTQTNDSAAAGNIGEYMESVVASVASAGSGTFGDLTSLTLTPGDWDITGSCYFSGGTGYTVWQLGISATSGNSTAGLVLGSNRFVEDLTSGVSLEQNLYVPAYRVSIAASTVYYLKFAQTNSGGSAVGSGRLSARRVR